MRINSGITLIALVITIVVLLILAGVSIAVITGDSGIIKKANESADESRIAFEKELVETSYINIKVKDLNKSVTAEELEKEIEKEGEAVEVATEEENLIITFDKTGNKYKINQDGIVTKIEELPPEEAEKIVNIEYSYRFGYLVEKANGEVLFFEETRNGKIEEVNIEEGKLITKSGIKSFVEGCFADKAGKVYTWGYASYGQLGDGTDNGYALIPTCISNVNGSPLNGKKIEKVYGSVNGGIVAAIDKEGKVYTWGDNFNGQLGDGTNKEYSNIPICISDIPGSALNNVKISKIYKDEENIATIVALDTNGKVYTWGEDGCLGDGSDKKYSNVPICISDQSENKLNGIRITDIATDGLRTIAVDTSGKIYTWGDCAAGELGDGNFNRQLAPICISDIPGNALNNVKISKISIAGEGSSKTIIALDTNGKVYTWGSRRNGLLGNGNDEDTANPICISEQSGSKLSGVKIINISSNNSSVVAVDSEGKVYTWGDNIYGCLGDKTLESSNIPVCISEKEGSILKNKKITDFYIGSALVIAIDENKKIYGWGNANVECWGGYVEADTKNPICVTDLTGSVLYNKKIYKYKVTRNFTAYITEDGKCYLGIHQPM